MKKSGRSILFTFGVASLLPILFIGIFLTIRMRKMAFEQTLNEAKAEIARVESRIEETLQFIHTIENAIVSDAHIMDVLQTDYHSPLEIFNSYSENKILNKYELTYSDISDIRIYVENETLLDNLDFMRATSDIKQMKWYQNAIALKGKSFGEHYCEEGPIIRKDYLMISRSFHLQKDMEGVMMILVDLKRIKSMMETEAFDLYLLDSENRLLMSRGNSMIGQKLNELENIDMTEGQTMWTTEFKGENSQVIVKIIDKSMLTTPLYLVSVIPIEQMVATSREVVLFGSLVIFLSLMGGLALIFGLSNLAAHQQDQKYMLFKEQMRFEVLASQVNPHFLFNVLESIRMKAHSNGENEIATIIKKMGALIRRNLEMNYDYITLREELSFVEDYLIIQKFRFGEKIVSSIHCSEELMQLTVLPLTIQPIVENAIIHGLEGVKEAGTVIINVKIEDGNLIITVSDNGKGIESDKIMNLLHVSKDTKENGEGRIGLQNIHQRIQIKFGKAYGLTLEKNYPRGTIVQLIMPIIQMKNKENLV
jgi:two-component system sensor histidine kinase YesM